MSTKPPRRNTLAYWADKIARLEADKVAEATAHAATRDRIATLERNLTLALEALASGDEAGVVASLRAELAEAVGKLEETEKDLAEAKADLEFKTTEATEWADKADEQGKRIEELEGAICPEYIATEVHQALREQRIEDAPFSIVDEGYRRHLVAAINAATDHVWEH